MDPRNRPPTYCAQYAGSPAVIAHGGLDARIINDPKHGWSSGREGPALVLLCVRLSSLTFRAVRLESLTYEKAALSSDVSGR